MALITWNASYSINVSEMDQQHQKLVVLINELHDAMLTGKAKDILGKIIDELINYTKYHFSAEEKYLDRFNYPETAAQKKEHIDFVNKIASFKQDFEGGRVMISMDVINFLKDWLINHIQVSDKKYSALFNANGMT